MLGALASRVAERRGGEESLYRIRESTLVQVQDHAPETSLSAFRAEDEGCGKTDARSSVQELSRL